MDKYYDFWLCGLPGIGYGKRRRLLAYFGSSRDIFYGRKEVFQDIPRLGEKDREVIFADRTLDAVKREYEDMEKRGIFFITPGEKGFPEQLRQVPEPPHGIFYRGSLPAGTLPAVAIVGARNASGEGRTLAEKFGRELAANGIPIISGMAQGVDIAAQRGAMDAPGGRTYGVLGTGVDICYPRNHLDDFMEIQKRGGLLSEFPLKTPPMPYNFPMRNRLISGLSGGILVIEAKEGSGSLITAEMGLEQGKEIFVIPGSICNPLYRGGNELLKTGACLVTKVQDVLDGLGLFFDEDVVERKKKTNVMLETTEKIVYAILSLEPVSMSLLVEETGLQPQKVLAALDSLQRKKLVREAGNNHYAMMM